jgi:multicomponent K+:H+ antiporter subunit D
VPGLHYVLINLAGSSFFLIAIGILYGVTGTLNMADLGLRLRSIDAGSASLVAAAGTMLQLVFLLKAAAFPLYFWPAPTPGPRGGGRCSRS